MRELHIKRTEKTPLIMSKDGTLEISGVSIPENPERFYLQINNWLDEYMETSDKLTIVFKAYYFNTSSIKYLLYLINKANEINLLTVVWFYEEDDEDIMDLGNLLSDITGIEFFINSTNDIPTYEGPTPQDNSEN